MATEKQWESNRANAKRSTGPRSAQGKAQSSMNACKHGLTAQTVVIDAEDPLQFDSLCKGLEQEFEPHSLIERELIERLAGIVWRLRRIPRFEAALIQSRCSEVSFIKNRTELAAEVASGLVLQEPIGTIIAAIETKQKPPEPPGDKMGLALIRDSQHQDALGKLSRHEAALMNAFTKTLQMLHFIQSQRSAEDAVIEAVPLPSNCKDCSNGSLSLSS